MKRILRRLAWSLFIVWSVTTLTFFINNILPSDPARMAAGPQARPKDVERIRAQLGLEKPAVVQYGIFMSRLLHVAPADAAAPEHTSCVGALGLHVDLGRSYQQRRPVATIIGERLPRTIFLALAGVLVQILIGVTSGVFAALKRGTAWDHGAVGLSLLGISAPTFILGLVLQFFFARKLRLLPLDGFGTTTHEHLLSVILPALTLGIFGAAYYTRLVRDEMIGLLREDYVRTARAKGLSEGRVVIAHALRNALVPLITVIALDLGALVGGAIVTESLFRWPGIGALSVNALLDRDGPIILGTVIVTSAAIVLASIFVDVCYVVLDPRVRHPG